MNTLQEQIIEKIQQLVEKKGNIAISDFHLESSPVVNQLGDTIQLAEEFYPSGAIVNLYREEQLMGYDFMDYEDMELETLKHILNVIEENLEEL